MTKPKNWKTTLIGCLLAGLMAAKPVLDGSGFHLDTKTICELTFAVGLAVFGVLMKDFNTEK